MHARKSLPFGLFSGTSGSVRALACCVLGAGGTWAGSVRTKVWLPKHMGLVTNTIILTQDNQALAHTEDIYWLESIVHEYISARKSHHGNSNGVQRKHESKSKGHY
jgi:hypothetical protein